MAAMVFSIWKSMVPFCVIGISLSGIGIQLQLFHSSYRIAVKIDDTFTLCMVLGYYRMVAVAGKKVTEQAAISHAGYQWIAALSTATPVSGMMFCTMTRLTTARSLRIDVCEAEVIAIPMLVTTATWRVETQSLRVAYRHAPSQIRRHRHRDGGEFSHSRAATVAGVDGVALQCRHVSIVMPTRKP